MSSMPRCDAASISITSSDVPARDPQADMAGAVGLGVGPFTQFRLFARMRAIDVLPVPRGPAKRYAWRTWPDAIAFFNVRTTAS